MDREACADYKEILDQFLPPEYSEVVYTGNNNDSAKLKKFHLDEKKERGIRKSFIRFGEYPKILIVTEKLLTGFDAPILYAMYLDKPMRDHTLLQAIARVNRPYENDKLELVKPHGFVVHFVGIFDKLEKALAFDSDEVNAIVKNLDLLKQLFQTKIEGKGRDYVKLIEHDFNDKDVDNLIDHFRDKGLRKELFKEYKNSRCSTKSFPGCLFAALHGNLRDAVRDLRRSQSGLCKTVYVDRAFQRKTNSLVQEHVEHERH